MRKTIALSLAFAVAAALPAWAQDVIRFKDPAKNPDIEGEISGLSFKQIDIFVLVGAESVKRSVEPRLVAEFSIASNRKSLDYARGEEAMANGNFDAAAQRFERTANDPRSIEPLRQLALIQIVRCHAAAGLNAKAIEAAQALRSRKADSYFVRESFETEVRAQLNARNPGGAARAVASFRELATANNFQDWSRSADLLSGQVSEEQGNPRDALVQYRKLNRDPELGDEATIGELRCLAGLADWPGLATRAAAVIKDSEGKKAFNARLLIAAYNGRGESAVKGGKVKEALFDFLQGAVVLSRGEKSPEHEFSLARTSLTCAALAAAETDRTKKDTFRGRAQEMLRELAGAYPGSKFIAEIQKAITALR